MADNEASLLASVGGAVASMDAYEEGVLQQATLDSAPQLNGVGFPEGIEAVLPSFDSKTNKWADSDVSHMRAVLSKTRSELSKTHDDGSHIGRIKEQMLLTILKQRLTPEELPIHAAREVALEEKWSKKLKSPASPPGSGEEGGNRMENTVATSTGTKSVRFASSSTIEKDSSTQPIRKRKRKTMMERKKGQCDELVRDETADPATRDMLRQRRKERDERKRLRRSRWEKEEDTVSSSDEEVEFGSEHNEQPSDTDKEDTAESLLEQSGPTVQCPLCEQPVQVTEETSEADAILSRHMDECQRKGRRTRSRRSSTMRKCSEDHSTSAPSPTGKAATAAKPRKKKRRVVRQRVPMPALDDLNDFEYEDRVDEWIESGLENMRDMSERDHNETPPGEEEYDGGLFIPSWINDRLFAYQRTGLRWMWELHTQGAGGIVGDEMGLGKTVQVCSYLGAMASCRKLKSVLVVAPATMLSHWLSELRTWAPGLRRVLVHKSGESDGLSRAISTKLIRKLERWLVKARADYLNEPIDEEDLDDHDDHKFCGTGYVMVTTYESIRMSPDIWTSHTWSYCVLDEGQRIRNPDADVTLACKRLRTPHRLLLSGTPIQNDLRELWSLFDFVFPGRLGTLPTFETEFADPIKRGGYSNASPMQVQLAYRCSLVLRDLINPYLLRRRKKDVKEVNRMPGKTEQVLFCRLSSRQRAIYEAYLKSDEVRNIMRGSPQLLRSITVLRKICNHPDLVCGADDASFQSFVRNGYVKETDEITSDEDESDSIEEEDSMIERSGKLEVLAKILPLWRKQGHRVLIFCQWKKMLNIIERFTSVQGWKFGRMDGNTSVASRQKLVDSFNEDESYFGMILTTRTGGVGLNLTGADRIILYDPDWNPQTDAQARERAWRFGQKNPVTVYRLITAGTVEEKIYHRQIFKTALSNKILQDPRQRRLFSQKDLRDLFTLKADVGSVTNGGHGLTETGQITLGGGVVDPDESDRNSKEEENEDTLETVMKSRGLAGIFDHDFIDNPASKKTASAVEMEEQAKRVAREAASALKFSAPDATSFQPTWTGSSETKPGRFGSSSPSVAATLSGTAHNGIGGKGIDISSNVRSNAIPPSSGDLLSRLRKQGDDVASASKFSGSSQLSTNGDTQKYAELMKSVRKFIADRGGRRQGGGPSTYDILSKFDSIPHSDAAIFRRLLISVARIEGGKWRLKE